MLNITKKIALLGGVLLSTAAYGADDLDALLNMPLANLSNVKVTSVSKRSERAFDAAAAVHVITRDDILNSGATNVAEALRLAPGVQVARAGTNRWAISIRGFNDQFANKLLVLVDGRSVYTPLFSGVYWDIQDLVLEDIKQIEVIRGPGATLWGANAVNGIINIITEEAANTQNTVVSVTHGTEEQGTVMARVGGKSEQDIHYRVYAKRTARDESRTLRDAGAQDEMEMLRTGFRADWNKTERDFVTVQGDIYYGEQDQQAVTPTLTLPYSATANEDELVLGGNILGRWKRDYDNGSSTTVQSYLDSNTRDISYLRQRITTLDFDVQHSFAPIEYNEFMVGAGYRMIDDELNGSTLLNYNPEDRTVHFYSAFVQDKVTVIPEKVYVTLGSKFENNSYTGFEVQPSARVSWLVRNNQTLWASVARAVRVANRNMDDVSFAVQGTPFGYARLVGDRAAESEDVVAYEIGYRIQPSEDITFDVATFYNDYTNLISNNLLNPITASPANKNSGRSYGAEIGATWKAMENWELAANYSYLQLQLDVVNGSAVSTEGKSPKHQFMVSSNVDLPHDVELNNYLYYTDELRGISVPAYARFDTKLGWKPKEGLELSLVGQNLFDDAHQEFSAFTYTIPEEVGRAVYANIRWYLN